MGYGESLELKDSVNRELYRWGRHLKTVLLRSETAKTKRITGKGASLTEGERTQGIKEGGEVRQLWDPAWEWISLHRGKGKNF